MVVLTMAPITMALTTVLLITIWVTQVGLTVAQVRIPVATLVWAEVLETTLI